MPAAMNKKKTNTAFLGFSLVEILVALTILTFVAGSIFSAFSTSRQMLYSAKELSEATSLASSYLAAVTQIRRKDLSAFPLIDEASLPGPFKPETLNLPPATPPYYRKVSVFAVDRPGLEGGPFFKVNVEITWTKKSAKAEPVYLSSTIIRGRP